MTNFDWRTDEEKGWDKAVEPELQGSPRQPGWRAAQLARRRWRIVLVSFFMLAALGAFGARTLTLRVQAAEVAAREEALAAHGVLLEAARLDDAELFLTMLGGDRSWRREQLAAFEGGAFLQRRALGLEWLPQLEAENEIGLSPDLQQALITSTLRYEGYAGGSAPQVVALQHVLRYERDGAQWRHVPHENAISDGWVTDEDELVLTLFPTQDQELAARLAEDVRAAVRTMCALVECPTGLHLQISFESHPEMLYAPTVASNVMRRDSFSLALPAPSVVGLPVDERGYRALRNAYLRVIVDQIFDTVARGIGGATNALHDARHRKIFADLQLVGWPRAEDLVNSKATVDGDILALCATGPGLGASLLRFDGARGSWHVELGDRNLLQMVALDRVGGVLLREQRETARRTGEPQPSIVWWDDGRELAHFEDYYLGDSLPASPAFVAAGTQDGHNYWFNVGAATDCNGRSCSGIVTHEEPAVWSPGGQYTLFRRELEGSRSPPASDEILWLGDGNGEALQRLGEGFHPFWIDDETFGYLLLPERPAQPFPLAYDLVIRRLEGQNVGEERRMPLRMMEALQQLAPQDAEVQEMGIAVSYAFAHPSRPQTIYILGARFTRAAPLEAAPQYSIFLFAVDAQSGAVTVRVASEQRQWTSLPRLSPDGRWLAYATYDLAAEQGAVAVHDLASDTAGGNVYEQTLAGGSASLATLSDGTRPFDWSEHSGYLLILEDGILTVLDPQSWQAQQIVPPTAGCAHAAWAN